jgi:hypothetical protein
MTTVFLRALARPRLLHPARNEGRMVAQLVIFDGWGRLFTKGNEANEERTAA